MLIKKEISIFRSRKRLHMFTTMASNYIVDGTNPYLGCHTSRDPAVRDCMISHQVDHINLNLLVEDGWWRVHVGIWYILRGSKGLPCTYFNAPSIYHIATWTLRSVEGPRIFSSDKSRASLRCPGITSEQLPLRSCKA